MSGHLVCEKASRTCSRSYAAGEWWCDLVPGTHTCKRCRGLHTVAPELHDRRPTDTRKIWLELTLTRDPPLPPLLLSTTLPLRGFDDQSVDSDSHSRRTNCESTLAAGRAAATAAHGMSLETVFALEETGTLQPWNSFAGTLNIIDRAVDGTLTGLVCESVVFLVTGRMWLALERSGRFDRVDEDDGRANPVVQQGGSYLRPYQRRPGRQKR